MSELSFKRFSKTISIYGIKIDLEEMEKALGAKVNGPKWQAAKEIHE